MKYLLVIYVVVTTAFTGLYLYERLFAGSPSYISPLGSLSEETPDTTLQKYAFPELGKQTFSPAPFALGREVQNTEELTSYIAYIDTPDGKVSGMLNLPKTQTENRPFIMLLRGFVDRSIYETGIGSQRIGEELAKEGYVTFSPDFLGYAESSPPSMNPMEERFQGYTTALTVLASVGSLNEMLADLPEPVSIDTKKVGIWGHSNGGHIALSLLAITGKPMPTVLWAPVSKPFPYSILYYTDEYDDGGKALRKLIADFEQWYDVTQYSTNTFYDKITAPIQIHQGLQDEPVPAAWSQALHDELTDKDKTVELFMHQNSDHNLAPDGWQDAAAQTIAFFNTRVLVDPPSEATEEALLTEP